MSADESPEKSNVAVIGLGSMGFGMASSLVRRGHAVIGYDPSATAAEKLAATGARIAKSPGDAAANASVVLSVVVNSAQTDAVLFADGGVFPVMAPGSVFISAATMGPSEAKRLSSRLVERDILYLDAPISGGAAKAASGALTIMASGSPNAFERARHVLDAIAEKVYRLGDEPGIGASVKMINQHLAGIHIAAACEAMVLASKLGLDLSAVYEVITASAGNSWMFENRVPHILDGDYSPLSSVEIFVKDLGILQDMARAERYPIPLAAAALQMYLATSGACMGRDDDASVARTYASLSGA